jgi:hypothetical protein
LDKGSQRNYQTTKLKGFAILGNRRKTANKEIKGIEIQRPRSPRRNRDEDAEILRT